MIVGLDIGRGAAISSFHNLAIVLREVIGLPGVFLLYRIDYQPSGEGEDVHQTESAKQKGEGSLEIGMWTKATH